MKKLVLVIIALVVLVAGFFAYRFFRPAVTIPASSKGYFYIGNGNNLSAVRQALIDSQYITGNDFKLVAKLLKYRDPKPGRYQLTKGMSLYTLVKLLRSGQQSEIRVVINKERTKELFAGRFGTGKRFDLAFDSLAMISYLNNSDSLKKFGVDSGTVMSIVMPYTYEVKWNTTPDRLFQQFYASYKKFWTEERRIKADSLHLTPLQVIALASIVEEETNKKADKYNIASTYLNRVRLGMKLQADPTVKYAMRNFGLTRVLGKYLDTESPYNTYKYAGIPPGPICTPSAESIDAVLDAPRTDYLFFVASHKFDGTSVFTTNLSDHSRYARLYQQELTRRQDSSRKAKEAKLN